MNTDNIVLFLAIILGKLPKMKDPKSKIEYLTELAVKIMSIKTLTIPVYNNN
jgi:hypothetical protein